VIADKNKQLQKHPTPIEITEFGIVIDDKDKQL
jgi:hypothetical protein